MRPFLFLIIILSLVFLMSRALSAQPLSNGNEAFIEENEADQTPQAERDVFSAGLDIELREPADKDVHVAGLSVLVSAATGGDLYAAGGTVRINAAVGEDLSAIGFSVSTGPEATIGGDARLSGGSVRIAGPIAGSLLVSGGSIVFDAPVDGDVWLAARDVDFGPNAVIAGTIHITSPNMISVPARVAPADQVVLERRVFDEMPMHDTDWGEEWSPHWTNIWMRDMGRGWATPNPVFLFGGVLLTLAFLLAIGAAALALAPGGIEGLRNRISKHPWITLSAGVIGLSTLVGLVPVTAMNLVGLPLVPFVVLASFLLWTVGYVMGVYAIAVTVLSGTGRLSETTGIGTKLLALAVGLLIATLLNFVPILGWIINLGVGFLGVGAMVMAVIRRMPETAVPPELGQA